MALTPVERLRQMVGAGTSEYTIGATTYWSDVDLQAALDNRIAARLVQTPIETYPTVAAGTGGITHLEGRIPARGTLDLATLKVISFTGRVYDQAEYTAFDDGRITFQADQLGFGPLASGLSYDLNAAAADVLTSWASAVKLGYDISTSSESLKRGQRFEMLSQQAAAFRALALPSAVSMASDRGGQRSQRRPVLKSFERWGRWA